MDTFEVKINFLHTARPCISADEYANIVVSCPSGALPNKGDIIEIEDIKRREGAFVVAYRVFELRQGSLYAVTLTLGIEGEC